MWESERLHAAGSAALKELLEGRSPAPAGALATPMVPPPGEVEARRIGGYSLQRWPQPASERGALGPALAAWRASTPGARYKIKVIGVEVGELRLILRARVESVFERSEEVVQETAVWRTTWRREEDDLELRSIDVERWQRSAHRGPAFEEVNAALFRKDPAAAAQLARGGEWWPGRIDAVGELPLMGHNGLAVGDLDGDGLEDLYLGMPTGVPNQLWLRQPDGSLRETAEEAHVAWLDDTKGVVIADMDGDGDRDLLCAIGPTIVLGRNDGKGRFDRFVSMRAPTPAAFYQLSVADYDLDGDLDIYGVRYVAVAYGVSVPLPYHDANNGPRNHLLRNEGALRFRDVTAEVGLDANNRRFSVAAAWGDVDGDGDPDLYVSNDFGRNNLYLNLGGRFEDRARACGVEDQAAGMGVSFGDADEDGDLDLYVTNMWSSAGQRIAYQSAFHRGASEAELKAIRAHGLGNSLFLNAGDGRFERAGARAGVRVGRWGWGARFADLNSDGRLDLVAPNGFLSGRVKDDL